MVSANLEQVVHKEQIRMIRIKFFRIQIYDQVDVYKLQAMYTLKWDDYSEGGKCHKISKFPIKTS